jgi:hypothetical protein
MNANRSARQFILDGLLGLSTTMLLFLLDVVTWGMVTPALDVFPHLIFITIIASFLGTGLGTHLLANVSSRAGWLISLFGVSLISWLVTMGSIIVYITLYSEPRFRNDELYLLPTYAVSSASGAGIGFVITSLVGVIFQPTRRYAKVFMCGMITAFTGYVFALLYILIALIPT